MSDEIAEAELRDWRKLAQGLHAATWSTASPPPRGSSGRWVRRAMRWVTTRACRWGPDTSISATIAPVRAVLLSGSADPPGRGTPSDEIRDATGRVPNLWFGELAEDEPSRQRFHVEVYVAPEVAARRVAAAVAAGGRVVDDSAAPALTVIADQDGNTGVVCADVSAAVRA